MKRDFEMMRAVLGLAAAGNADLPALASVGEFDQVVGEVRRLEADGLVESSLMFDPTGLCFGGEVVGLTDEGAAFFRLVEKPEVWDIVRRTLEAAGIDVSYPLLKEVCEEIVKRYVMKFIPD